MSAVSTQPLCRRHPYAEGILTLSAMCFRTEDRMECPWSFAPLRQTSALICAKKNQWSYGWKLMCENIKIIENVRISLIGSPASSPSWAFQRPPGCTAGRWRRAAAAVAGCACPSGLGTAASTSSGWFSHMCTSGSWYASWWQTKRHEVDKSSRPRYTASITKLLAYYGKENCW